jgi:hypothetical protein
MSKVPDWVLWAGILLIAFLQGAANAYFAERAAVQAVEDNR